MAMLRTGACFHMLNGIIIITIIENIEHKSILLDMSDNLYV